MSRKIITIIKADVNAVKGIYNKMFKTCVGSGRAYEELLKEQQRHLKIVKNECGFRYLRFHGLLHDDMAVYSEDGQGNPVYNWQYVDLLYDCILRFGMNLILMAFLLEAWICKNDNGVQALFWNYTCADQKNISNQVYYKKDLPSLPAEKVQLCLSNLKPGKHQLTIYSVGYRQNDVYLVTIQ